MDQPATAVLHGFLQLPHLQKKRVIDAINDYFDSMDRESVRAEYDQAFEHIRQTESILECPCCGRSGSL